MLSNMTIFINTKTNLVSGLMKITMILSWKSSIMSGNTASNSLHNSKTR